MEEHTPQFRGCWLPADILQLFEQGAISAKEMVLLAMVDSLVAPDTGCYASNAYLGARLHCGPDQVRRMVSKLRGMGLLVDVGFDGKKRYLETAWSRVQTRQKRRVRPGKSAGSPIGNNKANKTPSRTAGAVAASECRANADPKAQQHHKEERMPLIETNKAPQGNATDDDKAMAKLLATAIGNHGGIRVPYKVSAWATSFRLLRDKDGVDFARVDKVLVWYCQNIGGTYTPQAMSASAFREKFLRIEAAMHRAQPQTKEVELCPKGLAVFQASDHDWPAGFNVHLRGAIADSVANMTAFLEGLARVGRGGGWAGLARHIRGYMDVTTCLTTWFDERFRRALFHGAGWSGRVELVVWATGHRDVTAWGRQLAQEYTGDAGDWDKLLEAMPKAGA